MASIRTLQRSFNGGEISPEMLGQITDPKHQAGLALCRNFVVKPQGPVENRAGFAFVREVADSARRTRLIRFTYSTLQTMVIELGHGTIRFHTQGATLLQGAPAAYDNGMAYEPGDLVASGGTNYYCIAATTGNAPPDGAYWYPEPASGVYQIPSPYGEDDVFDIHYVQSADVLTLVHPGYEPRELRRLGATSWVLAVIPFTPQIAAPANVVATPSLASTDYDYAYVVTAIAADGISESVASTAGTCQSNIFTSASKITITWDAVSGASRYNVFKMQGGLYGYIGQTSGTSLVDDNIAPDLSKTPPVYETVFSGTGDYPAGASYWEQRRTFAGTTNKPQNLWMTRSGTESNMSYSLPVRDDDRISFRVAAREANTIRHVVPLGQLILLTSAAEWVVSSINSDAITPSTLNVRPQSYVGASNVQPEVINNALIYCAARGGHVRELAYNWQANGFVTGDLCLRAAHLFDSLEIVDMAYQKAPQPIVWAVSSNGKLLGLTYVPEQQVGAWHQHDTVGGAFESCCVVAEGGEDFLYCVVRRTIDGNEVRYVERMASRKFTDPADAFFVDCGITYDGAPETDFAGLDHLEGQTVAIFADGAPRAQQTVTGGQIVLDIEASKVQIGLPITADLQTLPIAAQIDAAFGQGREKNVNKVWLRVYESSGISAGPSLDKLTPYKQRSGEPYDTPPALKTQEIRLAVSPRWGDGGQVYIRQQDPLPLTIVSMSVEVALGS